jgi:hypothetical protein
MLADVRQGRARRTEWEAGNEGIELEERKRILTFKSSFTSHRC